LDQGRFPLYGYEDLPGPIESEVTQKGFGELALSKVMIAALAEANYQTPTPVQAGMIPRALEGIDIVAQARTGTGKTAAFVIPILERLKPRSEAAGPQALILVPTRELAVQVHDELQKLAHGRPVRCVAIYGGKPIRGQIDKLRRGAQIIVGTPGRVLDHISRRTLDLAHIRWAVLDEADRMLDIGFRPDIERILKKCPDSRQTLLLSATVPPPIQRLAQRYMRDPLELDFSPTHVTVETIQQFYFTIDQLRKPELLNQLLQREQPKQAIIFCRTKRGTQRTYERLKKRFQHVGCIHGDMPQSARDHIMQRFRAGQIQLLAATDVVGRGIDVTSISHIINYDIPQFCDDYIHRVGRTGRMGREGVAFTFVTPEEGPQLTRIEMRIDRLLQRDEIKGFEAERPPSATAAETSGESPQKSAATTPQQPPAPLLGRRGRPPKRYRRAL
jgi:ATP-dependent RNA helicase DeaD